MHEPRAKRRIGTAWRWSGFAGLLGFVFLAGCGPAASHSSGSGQAASDSVGQQRPEGRPPDNRPSPNGAAGITAKSDASNDRSAPPPRDAVETWDVCRIGGSPVGYVRTRVSQVPLSEVERPVAVVSQTTATSAVDAGNAARNPMAKEAESRGDQTAWRVDIEQSLTLKRDGQIVRQNMTVTSWETVESGLLKFESRVASGRELTISRGIVENAQLRITTNSLGKTESTLIPWQRGWGGFYALELRLRGGVKPRQRLEFQSLVPMLNQPGKSQLEVVGFESTRTTSGSQQLLKIKRRDQLGGFQVESSLWVDESGQVLKSLLPIPPPGIETVRSTREAALADTGDAAFDLGQASAIRLAQPLDQPHARSSIVYRARLRDGSLDGVFAAGASQQIKRLDDHTAEIRVLAVRPDRPETLAVAEPEPTDEDRSANGLVQCDDPAIVALARQAAPDETGPWKIAVALERLVREHVKPQPTSQALASAAEVVRTGEGDCTEHAVLLAALCRARGIPARVAIGLVYAPSVGGFAYHMWNEVWIRDRWIPLDSTLAQGGIGAGHLKLVTSSLRGADAYSAFLPVYQVLGRLELQAIEVTD